MAHFGNGPLQMNLSIETRPYGVYRLRDIFSTQDGTWELTPKRYGVDAWARVGYLRREFDDAGGDHHLFARVEDEQGNAIATDIEYWSDPNSDPNRRTTISTGAKKSGWANLPLFAGSYFDPDKNERGPWRFGPKNAYEIVAGAGLPFGHVSTFAVWVVSSAPPPPPQPDVVELAYDRPITVRIKSVYDVKIEVVRG